MVRACVSPRLDTRWHSAIFEERDISPDDVRSRAYVRPRLEITTTTADRDARERTSRF